VSARTIFALATPPGRGAVAIIRISGEGARDALANLGVRRPAPRRASLKRLTAADGRPLDDALVLWFPAPHSFTGEDCAELHLHGGPAIVDAVGEALMTAGLAPAGPGEFTRRAFENGRLDLAQAEAVADLVEAETSAQARQALGQLHGDLGLRYRDWRRRLVAILAQLEAAVDFPDEEVPADIHLQARADIADLRREVDEALAGASRGRQVREGYRIAAIGAPNAGKSTLYNSLCGRAAAIVTPEPGTTRDVLEARLDIAGYAVLLADTAGLREGAGSIEAEGVRRARQWAGGADLRLWLVDRSGARDWRAAADLVRAGDLCLFAKADLPSGDGVAEARAFADDRGIETMDASVSRDGTDEVLAWIASRVTSAMAGADFPAVTRARHAEALSEAAEALARAERRLPEPELAAEDMRLAVRALARISGEIDAEAVLDALFGSFCIGK